MSTRRLTGVLLMTVLAAACRTPAPSAPAVDTAAEEAMLTAATDPWFAAFNAGDAEAVTAHYADDAVVMPPHAPVAKGREAIKALMTTDVAATMIPGTNGDFAWGGAASTYFWVDPKEDLVAIFLTQLLPSDTYPIRRELRTFVYSAFEDAEA